MKQPNTNLPERISELEDELARCKEREQAIHNASKTISSDISLDKVLHNIVVEITETLNSSGCTVSLWHSDRDQLETMVDFSRENPEDVDEAGSLYNLADFPKSQFVLENAQTTIIQYDDLSEEDSELALMNKWEMYTLVMVPLVAKDQVIGMVELYEEVKPRIFSIEEINLIESLTSQAAISIWNSQLYEEIKSLSLYDPLTGLANRRMMDIHLKKMVLRAKRNDKGFYLLMLDIDYFKTYNDTFGHEAGDIILKKIANIFRKTVRESDLTARYGGEEFLIAISDNRAETIEAIAERIRKQVEDETDVTISIGISYFNKGLELNELIKEADKALYKAKDLGKNRYVFSELDGATQVAAK